MIFIFGPLWSGKRAAAKELLGWNDAELSRRAVWDVQELARERTDLETLAEELSRREVVIATEVGGGIVPVEAAEREARERAFSRVFARKQVAEGAPSAACFKIFLDFFKQHHI